jgi:NAD(P)-dependent dehydrogenase (short-subunit alcohol dehydrogenase family)
MSTADGGRFAGKVAIVTGGAGGIGSAVARRLVADGARVALVDVAKQALAKLREELGENTCAIEADVAQEEDCGEYVRQTVEQFGQVDLFFNNAGIEGKIANIVDLDIADFDRLMAINVRGVVLGLREVMRQMKRQATGGAIVNTASIAGLRGNAGVAPYIASKHAVIGLTKSAAMEAAAFGVRVNAVAPGYIDTRMLHSLWVARSPDNPEAFRASMEERVPLKRLGKPDDVSNLVTWLLSDEASYLTGSVYLVDAGIMA